VGSPRSRNSGKSISRRLQFLATETANIPQSLHSQSPKAISLQELATKLGVSPERLLPAIKHKYLKIIMANPPVVYEPPPAAIEWLKGMFEPILMRPFLELGMVAEIENLTIPDTRLLCASYDIPIQIDPVFGELLTIAAFRKLHISLHHYREPSRFDRQAMLVALMRAADPENYKADLKPPTFSVRLEKEIRRIAKLPEPYRTEMALRLWEQFSEAKGVADCIAAARGLEPATIRGMARVEKMIAVEEENPAG
jgi:hypothetical protein